MNILLSCVGRRGYLARWFRESDPEVRVLGTSNSWWTAGFADCDESHILPGLDSAQYADQVVDLCRRQGVDALLSLFDRDLDVLSRAREQLASVGTRAILPDPTTSATCLDKLAAARFMTRHGLPCVETFGDVAEVRAALDAGSISLPLIAKDRLGYASLGLQRVRTREQLEVAAASAPEGALVFQPTSAGQEYSLDLLNDLDGQPNVVAPKRKIRMRAGETDQAETVSHPGLVELGVALARSLQMPGPIDVDLFVDGDDIRILEVNPRFGGGYPCTHLAGGDFPGRLVEMLRGGRPTPAIGTLPAGVRMLKALSFVRADQLPPAGHPEGPS